VYYFFACQVKQIFFIFIRSDASVVKGAHEPKIQELMRGALKVMTERRRK
jgi:hypothetical protein